MRTHASILTIFAKLIFSWFRYCVHLLCGMFLQYSGLSVGTIIPMLGRTRPIAPYSGLLIQSQPRHNCVGLYQRNY